MDFSMSLTLKDIPYFKQVIIMAVNCPNCGHRSNEVKSGGNRDL